MRASGNALQVAPSDATPCRVFDSDDAVADLVNPASRTRVRAVRNVLPLNA